MSITVYDYKNSEKQVELPGKEIESIFVCVLSGDETGTVTFTDGTEVDFDASENRIQNFYDGRYTVKGDEIQKWIGFQFSGHRTKSYERQDAFDK